MGKKSVWTIICSLTRLASAVHRSIPEPVPDRPNESKVHKTFVRMMLLMIVEARTNIELGSSRDAEVIRPATTRKTLGLRNPRSHSCMLLSSPIMLCGQLLPLLIADRGCYRASPRPRRRLDVPRSFAQSWLTLGDLALRCGY